MDQISFVCLLNLPFFLGFLLFVKMYKKTQPDVSKVWLKKHLMASTYPLLIKILCKFDASQLLLVIVIRFTKSSVMNTLVDS